MRTVFVSSRCFKCLVTAAILGMCLLTSVWVLRRDGPRARSPRPRAMSDAAGRNSPRLRLRPQARRNTPSPQVTAWRTLRHRLRLRPHDGSNKLWETYEHWLIEGNSLYIGNKPIDDDELASLTQSLHQKTLDAESTAKVPEPIQTCSQLGITNYNDTCSNDPHIDPDPHPSGICLRTDIPRKLSERIESLVLSENILEDFRKPLEAMRSQVKGGPYDVIIASAVSSSYYEKSQIMLKNVHSSVYPVMRNFSLVMVDIGLSADERKRMEKLCRCQVVSFPFDKTPTHLRERRCYAWKPYIVAALSTKAEVVMWADSSVRFTGAEHVLRFINQTKSRGFQVRCDPARDSARTPFHTIPAMFEAYGDSPCAHFPFRQVEAAFAAFHSEPLIIRALVQPWLACAAKASCMCPPGSEITLSCTASLTPLTREIGFCNRFDQSALSIVAQKLFRENFYHFAVDTLDFQKIRRHILEE